ncbi:MAG TPA: hypothetical protein VGP47_03330 [Parachlamydiaceae bacterium]|nr:hypothetical protein [Parachlamydiaceae bacterium]
MRKIFFIFLLGISIHAPIHSEIEQITIRWTAQLCQGTCPKLLVNELKKVQGIDEIFIDQGSGQATLTWKARVPFQYTSINTAMRMVGLSIRDIRIKVRGIVKHSGDVFYILSDGDNTRFDLMNPAIPIPHGQTSEYNALARKISPALRQQLLDGETQKLIATIEGPVFMPERKTVPTQIVVDNLNFTSPDVQKR